MDKGEIEGRGGKGKKRNGKHLMGYNAFMKNDLSSIVLVFNDRGELALQLRAAKDNQFPLHWDFSPAGGIHEGEDHKTAAVRELREELGIVGTLEYIGEEFYQGKGFTDRMYIYKTIHNGPFNPDPVEVEEVKFFPKEKISEMLNSKVKFHPEFIYMWNKGILKEVKGG